MYVHPVDQALVNRGSHQVLLSWSLSPPIGFVCQGVYAGCLCAELCLVKLRERYAAEEIAQFLHAHMCEYAHSQSDRVALTDASFQGEDHLISGFLNITEILRGKRECRQSSFLLHGFFGCARCVLALMPVDFQTSGRLLMGCSARDVDSRVLLIPINVFAARCGFCWKRHEVIESNKFIYARAWEVGGADRLGRLVHTQKFVTMSTGENAWAKL